MTSAWAKSSLERRRLLRRRARGSARRRRTGRRRRRASRARARAGRPRGRSVRGRARRASSRRARSPANRARSQPPRFSAACACGMFRASARSSAIVCSAAEYDGRLGGVRDDDPAPRRRVDVDVVDPDSGAADHPQPLGPLDERGVERRRRAHDDRVEVADDRGEVGRRSPRRRRIGAQELETRLGDRLANEDAKALVVRHARRRVRLERARDRRARARSSAPRSTSSASTAARAVVMSSTS